MHTNRAHFWLAANLFSAARLVHFQTAHPKLSKSTINKPAKLASRHSEFQKQNFPKIKLDRVKENRICKKDTGIENTLQQHL
jgi:hypothetical protein